MVLCNLSNWAKVFNVDYSVALKYAVLCALIIYLIERIVIALPSSTMMTIFRLLLAGLVSLLGASAFDLVLFEDEINSQLVQQSKEKVEDEYGAK